MRKGRNILYRESQSMVSWAILLLIFAFGSSLVMLLLLISVPEVPLWPKLLLMAGTLALAVIIWTFRRLSTVLTDAEISFGCALIRKPLRWQDIESIQEEPYLFTHFWGWGHARHLRFHRAKRHGRANSNPQLLAIFHLNRSATNRAGYCRDANHASRERHAALTHFLSSPFLSAGSLFQLIYGSTNLY